VIRTRHVTMGAVTFPPRRPEDAAGDADIMRRIRAGDRTAVDALYDRFRRPAFALARRILADDNLAEDVLQEVFLSVWRDPDAFDRGRGSVASWLLAVVHHKAVDAVRREESQRRRQAMAEEDMTLDAPTATRDIEEEAWSRVVAEKVRRALGVLSPPQREALTLAYYGGYTQREVAALTGAPLGTVKTRMLTGMRRLKQELGGSAGGDLLGGGALSGGASIEEPLRGPVIAACSPPVPVMRSSTSWPSAGRCTRSSPRTKPCSPSTCPGAPAARRPLPRPRS
jgi:RNA polymerase sigma factor (sigma-70 family)